MRNLINLRTKSEFIYNEVFWGNEAKNGLSIYFRLTPMKCPNCGRLIHCQSLVHEKVGEDWRTFCKLCRPELEPALSNN